MSIVKAGGDNILPSHSPHYKKVIHRCGIYLEMSKFLFKFVVEHNDLSTLFQGDYHGTETN